MRKFLLKIISGIFLTVFLLFGFKSASQSYFFRHYQVENGLSNNSIYCSTQDDKGFLWFGTKDGLNRFDGYHFKLFNIQEQDRTFKPDAITFLFNDEKNVLWVGSQKGLFFFDTHKEKLVRFIDSLPEINAIQTDGFGQLWLISGLTLCKYNFKTKTLTKFAPSKYFEATSLCKLEDGNIWVSTRNGYLVKHDEANNSFQSFSMFSHSPVAISHWIQKIYPAGKNSLYVGTSSQGLKQFDVPTLSYKDILTYNADKTTVYIRDIIKYADNEFWFATESGIFVLNTITQKFINIKKKFLDPYSLSDNAVYTLCKDLEGGIWAGTFFGGVNYYSKQYAIIQKYFPDNSKNSISGSAVREICEDYSGNLWIGTEDAGLNKMNIKTGVVTQFKPTGESNSIAYTNIHGLLVIKDELWIGTFEHGLDIMDIKSGKIKQHYAAGTGKNDLKSNFAVSLLQTKSGDIYVGTSNSLFKYNSRIKGFNNVEFLSGNAFISCMWEDGQHNIWVGTHDRGVYYFNPITNQKGHFENEPGKKNSLSTNTINAIFEDSKNNLWFSTEGGGLCKLSKNRKDFTAFTTKNGLPSNFIFKVLEDKQNKLWITTSRGLVNLNTANNAVVIYTKDNGLLNDQFNYNSGYEDAAGIMYFGSVKGMISFNPNEFSVNTASPLVYITAFQVQNKEVEINNDSSFLKKSIIYTDEIELPYDRSSISIDFAALSYVSPEMTTYSYLMKGLDKEWVEIKPNRKIYFTNLSPGKYIFKLKAAINGNWSKEKQLIIKINPPFWATNWAYLLYSVVLILLFYYLLKSYHIIIEDKKEKEIYEAKIDFFTNVAHEIRTPLTLIKGPVENLLEKIDELPEIKEDVITMERNANRLIALITQILDFRQTETKGFIVDFVKVNITEILKEDYQNFCNLAKNKKINYTIEFPINTLYAFADEEALHKIFSNLLNNAVKYSHKNVHVRLLPLENEGTNFTIEFENDGPIIPTEMYEKIFEPFYRLKDAYKQQGTGIGLALARSLTQLHMGKLYVKSKADVLNTFVLCMPLKPSPHNNNNKRK